MTETAVKLSGLDITTVITWIINLINSGLVQEAIALVAAIIKFFSPADQATIKQAMVNALAAYVAGN